MALADVQSCRIVGASNYYDFSVYAPFARAREHNIFPLYGLEVICLHEGSMPRESRSTIRSFRGK